MLHSGHRHRRSLHFAVGGYELFEGTKGAATEFTGDSVGPRQICIHHPHQAHQVALLRELVIDARVIASEAPTPITATLMKLSGAGVIETFSTVRFGRRGKARAARRR